MKRGLCCKMRSLGLQSGNKDQFCEIFCFLDQILWLHADKQTKFYIGYGLLSYSETIAMTCMFYYGFKIYKYVIFQPIEGAGDMNGSPNSSFRFQIPFVICSLSFSHYRLITRNVSQVFRNDHELIFSSLCLWTNSVEFPFRDGL